MSSFQAAPYPLLNRPIVLIVIGKNNGAFVEKALAYADDPERRPYIDGWEAYNEPVAATADEMKRLAEFEAERTRLVRAPTVIAVISRVTPNPAAPEWEQVLSCGAACFNLCLAANALGFGTSWITEWYSYSRTVQRALGLGERERIAGFIYIGTAKERQAERERPRLEEIVSRWNG